ncbi:MAG TPA: metal-dependent hydrolase [Candidatus Tectomicrobia bacterium]|nr:metal-dependent hydrolase [Candidatus Tectomicrobia bacterium]
MNPIVHTTLGLHMANLGFYQRYGRRATLILATASLFPDIDSVTFFISREAYSQYHRVFTHSLGGWVICGAIMALLTAHRDLKQWFLIDWGLWGLGMLGHTATDIITRWPIPVFYPLLDVRWSLAIISWGDGFLTTTWLALVVAAELFSKYRRGISRAALAIGFAYLVYRAFVPTPGPSWLSTLWYGFWMRR